MPWHCAEEAHLRIESELRQISSGWMQGGWRYPSSSWAFTGQRDLSRHLALMRRSVRSSWHRSSALEIRCGFRSDVVACVLRWSLRSVENPHAEAAVVNEVDLLRCNPGNTRDYTAFSAQVLRRMVLHSFFPSAFR